jgi:UDP-N-acetylglucosamine 2-epimerase (non-hydrolysing)
MGLDNIYTNEKPDLVLVHGDTTTTFAASLAAFYRQIPVGHVEAGLRTQQKYAPYPEEINRHLTGVLTDLHFAPTMTARKNLLREGASVQDIYVTGNTVIDALLATVREDYIFTDPVLSRLDFQHRQILLVTAHRRESWGEPMLQTFQALRDLITLYPNLEIVFPVHKNPVVREPAQQILGEMPRIHLIEPLDYAPFVNLMARCSLVLTDSGGLQEEAPSLGKPVLVLRETTERPEAITAGTVKLIGTDRHRLVAETRNLLEDPVAYAAMANAVNPYGDGQAARRIAAALHHYFGLAAERPRDFNAGA